MAGGNGRKKPKRLTLAEVQEIEKILRICKKPYFMNLYEGLAKQYGVVSETIRRVAYGGHTHSTEEYQSFLADQSRKNGKVKQNGKSQIENATSDIVQNPKAEKANGGDVVADDSVRSKKSNTDLGTILDGKFEGGCGDMVEEVFTVKERNGGEVCSSYSSGCWFFTSIDAAIDFLGEDRVLDLISRYLARRYKDRIGDVLTGKITLEECEAKVCAWNMKKYNSKSLSMVEVGDGGFVFKTHRANRKVNGKTEYLSLECPVVVSVQVAVDRWRERLVVWMVNKQIGLDCYDPILRGILRGDISEDEGKQILAQGPDITPEMVKMVKPKSKRGKKSKGKAESNGEVKSESQSESQSNGKADNGKKDDDSESGVFFNPFVW